MRRLSFRIPSELASRLEREAQRSNETQSQIGRRALASYLKAAEHERFLESMVASAKRLSSDEDARREVLEICEEFLPLENEALERAEGGGQGPEEPWWE